MTTRAWYRIYPGVELDPTDQTINGGAFTVYRQQGPANVNATLVRQFLDLHAYARVRVDTPLSIPPEWWDQLTIQVGVGVDTGDSITPLHLAGPVDKRVTGTGFMRVGSIAGTSRQTGWEHATFDLTVPIETQGMRKTPTPGKIPVGNLTVQVSGGANVFMPNAQWSFTMQGYWRMLWETP